MKGQQEDVGAIDLSDRLRVVMSIHELTVAELAAAAGVSKSAMEKYLAGPSSPRAATIVALCRAFGLSANWLLFGHVDLDGGRIRRDAEYVVYGLLEDLKKEGALRDRFNSLEMGGENWRWFIRELADLKAVAIVNFIRESEWQALKDAQRGIVPVHLGPYPLVFSKPNSQGQQ